MASSFCMKAPHGGSLVYLQPVCTSGEFLSCLGLLRVCFVWGRKQGARRESGRGKGFEKRKNKGRAPIVQVRDRANCQRICSKREAGKRVQKTCSIFCRADQIHCSTLLCFGVDAGGRSLPVSHTDIEDIFLHE